MRDAQGCDGPGHAPVAFSQQPFRTADAGLQRSGAQNPARKMIEGTAESGATANKMAAKVSVVAFATDDGIKRLRGCGSPALRGRWSLYPPG
jgi:hypothetical protein